MGELGLNTLGTQVRATLLEGHPDWADYVVELGDGDLELAVPAPPGSRAGHLVVFTNEGKDIWIRYAHPHMCYAVDSLEEMDAVIAALLADDAFFVVVTRGDEWIETTLLRPGEEPALVEGQVANIVSWYGQHDKIVTHLEGRPSKGERGA